VEQVRRNARQRTNRGFILALYYAKLVILISALVSPIVCLIATAELALEAFVNKA
jgi:hypothetical protein